MESKPSPHPLKHFKTIAAYCQGINIEPPHYPHFDIRRFEDNMPTVVQKMDPFTHEFYAIAIKSDGEGKAITGGHSDFPAGATIFFNTPFQMISWEIEANWKGGYLMFSNDFIAQSKVLSGIINNFTFLKLDESIPFQVPEGDLKEIADLFDFIYKEYYGNESDKFALIEAKVYVILVFIRRLFEQLTTKEGMAPKNHTAELRLLSRYLTTIQVSFYPNAQHSSEGNIHSTKFYAERLNVHPNYLNAISKKLTGQTALSHIHGHIVTLAKTYMLQTSMTVKEVAYTFFFESPNTFSSFFKRHTGYTPLEYRKRHSL